MLSEQSFELTDSFGPPPSLPTTASNHTAAPPSDSSSSARKTQQPSGMSTTPSPEISNFYSHIFSQDSFPSRSTNSSPSILTSADVLGARFLHLTAEGTLEKKRHEESLKLLTKCERYDKNCVFCVMVDLLKAQEKK